MDVSRVGGRSYVAQKAFVLFSYIEKNVATCVLIDVRHKHTCNVLLSPPSCQIQLCPGGAVRGRPGGAALLFVSVLPGCESRSHLQHHAGSAGTAAQAARDC